MKPLCGDIKFFEANITHQRNGKKNHSFKKEIVKNLDEYLRSNIVPHIPQKIKEKLRFVKKFGILNSQSYK